MKEGMRTPRLKLIEFARHLKSLTHDPRLRERLLRGGQSLDRTQLDRNKPRDTLRANIVAPVYNSSSVSPVV